MSRILRPGRVLGAVLTAALVVAVAGSLSGTDSSESSDPSLVAAPSAVVRGAIPGVFRVRTLLELQGSIEGFGHEGDRIVWANASAPCHRMVRLRDLRTRKTWALTRRSGPTCELTEVLGSFHQRMALAGRRALWGYVSVSNTAWGVDLFTATAGERKERRVGSFEMSGGLEAETPFRSFPMVGDGQTLAFSPLGKGAPASVVRVGRRTTSIAGTDFTVALAGSGSRLALAREVPAGGLFNGYPTWSPDGSRIAFISFRGEGGNWAASEVYIVSVKGGPARKLRVGSVKGFRRVEWAPTGDSLLLEQNGRLYIAPSAGGKLREVAPGTEGHWSPDGRRIAYRNGTRAFVVSAGGGRPTPLGIGASPSWSPDGTALAVSRINGIYVVPIDGSAARRVARTEIARLSPATGPQWSPDGSLIAFVHAARPGGVGLPEAQAVFVVRPDGGDLRRVGDFQPIDMHWSPDSKSLVAYDEERFDVVRIAADGSGQRKIAGGSGARWSPDGTRVVLTSTASRTGLELALINPDGSGHQVITSTTPAPGSHRVEIRRTGRGVHSSFELPTGVTTTAIALDSSSVALLLARGKSRTIELRKTDGRVLRRFKAPRGMSDELWLAGRWIVFREEKAIRLLDTRSARSSVLANVPNPIGLSVQGRRVAWAEQGFGQSLIRAVTLPRG